jgi:hypothetical protein
VGVLSLLVDGHGLTKRRSRDSIASIPWEDLEKVSLVATCGSPFGDCGCWLLVARGGRAFTLPLGRAGNDLFHRLKGLPGFRPDGPIETLVSRGASEYVWWRHGGEGEGERPVIPVGRPDKGASVPDARRIEITAVPSVRHAPNA